MAVRPIFLAAAGVVAVAGAIAVVVPAVQHAHDRADARAAVTAAHRVVMPRGASPSDECHGDGVVGCYTLTSAESAVTGELARALRTAASRAADVTCTTVAAGAAAGQQSCQVVVRWGDHAAGAFVDPHVVRRGAAAEVDGTLVSVFAS